MISTKVMTMRIKRKDDSKLEIGLSSILMTRRECESKDARVLSYYKQGYNENTHMPRYTSTVLSAMAQMVGVLSHTPKDCGFISRSGHITRFLV